ncbi:MAG: IclR family transcriptional regulator [Haloarculaceae archaeon]
MDDSSNAGGKTIQSVETALAVVDAIRAHEPVGLTTIAAEVDCSKSTVHHHVTTLLKQGYLVRAGGKYSLGPVFLSLGGQVRARQALFRFGRDAVDSLADRTGEQARLVVECDDAAVTLYQVPGERGHATDTHVGTSEPLYCTAAGKAFLADRTDGGVDAYLDGRDLEAHTADTVTDAPALRDELRSIRADGVSFDDGERYAGVRSVASTVGTGAGSPPGAVVLSAPVERMDDERFLVTAPEEVQSVAGTIASDVTRAEGANPEHD